MTDSNESNRRRWLSRVGYRLTDRECPHDDCSGMLWYDSHELVCGTCSYVIDMAERRRRRRSSLDEADSPWEEFWNGRPTYFDNERKKKCVGGFLGAYDWLTGDESDGPIASVDPSEFYR